MLRYCKVRDVKSPTRGTNKAAGIDFYIPNDFKPIGLWPGDDVLIPSGIKAEIPEGYMLMGANKSGVSTSATACLHAGRTPKPGAFESSVIIGASIVDEDFQGEIFLQLINVGRSQIVLKPGMKIEQLVLVPVRYDEPVEVPEEELFKRESERGSGALGSTGSY